MDLLVDGAPVETSPGHRAEAGRPSKCRYCRQADATRGSPVMYSSEILIRGLTGKMRSIILKRLFCAPVGAEEATCRQARMFAPVRIRTAVR